MKNHINYFDQQDLKEYLQHIQNQIFMSDYLELLDN